MLYYRYITTSWHLLRCTKALAIRLHAGIFDNIIMLDLPISTECSVEKWILKWWKRF